MTKRDPNNVVRMNLTDRLSATEQRKTILLHTQIDSRDPRNGAVRIQNTLEQVTDVLLRFTTDAFCFPEVRGDQMDEALVPLHDALHVATESCLAALTALSQATGETSPLVERGTQARAEIEAEMVHGTILANQELLTSLFGEEIAADITRWASAYKG